MMHAARVVRRVVSGAYGTRPTIVSPCGMRTDAACVDDDANQGVVQGGTYTIAGHELTQVQALTCADATLRRQRLSRGAPG